LALHYYSADNAVTTGGVLNITTEQRVNLYKAFNEKTHKFYADKKYIQSAMLQGWNKFCFVGGIIEFSAKLPGKPHIGGLWPARKYPCHCFINRECSLTLSSPASVWMMGNLARATYVGSSDFMWPYSYNVCNERTRSSQEINACSQVNHYGLHTFEGRGAPEIDVIESMQGELEKLPNTFIQRPYQSASLQISPGIEVDRPILGMRPTKVRY
jgi:beta-glucan synthesis-associated protein KRE6